jgi:hypothetical protein
MRIGDMHFADSLLSVLLESATALSAPGNITARLRSLSARIMMDRKQYSEAEASLFETLKSMEGSGFEKDISAAYCWRALAQCFHYQQKTDKAEKARERSISIANSALGEKDPEAMMFAEPLA